MLSDVREDRTFKSPYATNRRTVFYDQVLLREQAWESTISSKVRNNETIMKYSKPSEVPKDVYAKALEDAEREKPNPLSEDERREILAEEVRAWCIGLKIAVAVGVGDTDLSAPKRTRRSATIASG
jgi:hypothetical protein